MSHKIIILLKETITLNRINLDEKTYLTSGTVISKGSIVNKINIEEAQKLPRDILVKQKSFIEVDSLLPVGSILRVLNFSSDSLKENSYYETNPAYVSSLQSQILTRILEEISSKYSSDEFKQKILSLEEKLEQENLKYLEQQGKYEFEIQNILEISKQQRKGLQLKIEDLTSYYKTMQEQVKLENGEQKMRFLQNKILEKEKELEVLEIKNNLHEERIKELVDRLEYLRSSKLDLEQQNNSISESISVLETQNEESLQDKINDNERRIKLLLDSENNLLLIINENRSSPEKIRDVDEKLKIENEIISLKLYLENSINEDLKNLYVLISNFEKELEAIELKLVELNEEYELVKNDKTDHKNPNFAKRKNIKMRKLEVQKGTLEIKKRETKNSLDETSAIFELQLLKQKEIQNKISELRDILETEEKESFQQYLGTKRLNELIEEYEILKSERLVLEDDNSKLISTLEICSRENNSKNLSEQLSDNETKMFEICSEEETINKEIKTYMELSVSLRDRISMELASKEESESYKCEDHTLNDEIRNSIFKSVSTGVSGRINREELISIAREVCKLREILNNLLKESSDKDLELNDIDLNNSKLLEEIKMLKMERDDLTEHLLFERNESKERIDHLKMTNDKLEECIEELKIHLTSTVATKNNLEHENLELTNTCKHLELEVSNLDEEIEKLELTREEIANSMDSSQEAFEKFRDHLEALDLQIKFSKEENFKLSKELNKYGNQKEKLIDEIQLNETLITDLQNRINNIIEDKSEKDTEMNKLIQENNKLYSEIRKYENVKKDLEDKIDYLTIQKTSVNAVVLTLEKKIKDLTIINSSLLESKERISWSLKETVNILQTEEERYENLKLESSNPELQVCRSTCENLCEKIGRLQSDNDDLENQLVQISLEENKCLEDLNALQEETIRLEITKERLSIELENVETENKILKNSQEYLQNINRDSLQRIAELSNILEELEKDNRTYISDRSKALKEKTELVNVIKILTLESQFLRDDSINLRLKFNEASTKLKQATDQELNLAKDNKELQKSVSQKNKELNILKIRYEDLYHQLKCLKKETGIKDPIDSKIIEKLVILKGRELETLAKMMDSMIKSTCVEITDRCEKDSTLSELSDVELKNLKNLKDIRQNLKELRIQLNEYSPECISKDIIEFFTNGGMEENEAKQLALKLLNPKTWTSKHSIKEVNDLISEIGLNLETSQKYASLLCSNDSENLEDIVKQLNVKLTQNREQAQILRGELLKSEEKELEMSKIIDGLTDALKENFEELSNTVPISTVKRLESEILKLEEGERIERELKENSETILLSMKNEKCILEEKLFRLTRDFEDLVEKYHILKSDYDSLKNVNNVERLNKLSKEYSSLIEEKRVLELEMNKLIKTNNDYESYVVSKIEKLMGIISQKDEEIECLKQTKNVDEEVLEQTVEYHNEIGRLKKKIFEFTSENENLLVKISEYHIEIERLKHELSQRTCSEEEIIRHQNLIEELLKDNKKKDLEIVSLKNRYIKSENHEIPCEEINSVISEMIRITSDVDHDFLSFYSKSLDGTLNCDISKIRNSSLLKTLHELLNFVHTDYSKDLEKLSNMNLETIKSIEKIIREIREIRETDFLVNGLQNRIQELMIIDNKIKVLSSKTNSCNSELLENEISTVDKELSKLKLFVTIKTKRIEDLQTKLILEEERIEELQTKNKLSKTEIAYLNQDLALKNSKVLSLQCDVDETISKIKLLEEQTNDSKDLIKKLNDKLWNDDREQKALKELIMEESKELEMLRKEIKKRDECMLKLDHENEHLRQSLENKEIEIVSLISENHHQKMKINAYKQSIEEIKQENLESSYYSSIYECKLMHEKVETLRSLVPKLFETQNSLLLDYKSTEEEILEFLKHSNIAIPRPKHEDTSDIACIQLEIIDCLSNFKIEDNLDIPHLYSNLKKDYELLRKKNGDLTSEIVNLRENFSECERQYKILEKTCENVETHLPDRDRQLSIINEQYFKSLETSKNELECERVKCQALESFCEELKLVELTNNLRDRQEIEVLKSNLEKLTHENHLNEIRAEKFSEEVNDLKCEKTQLEEQNNLLVHYREEVVDINVKYDFLNNSHNLLLKKLERVSQILKKNKISDLEELDNKLAFNDEQNISETDSPSCERKSLIRTFLNSDIFDRLVRTFASLSKVEKLLREGSLSIKEAVDKREKSKRNFIEVVSEIEDFIKSIENM